MLLSPPRFRRLFYASFISCPSRAAGVARGQLAAWAAQLSHPRVQSTPRGLWKPWKPWKPLGALALEGGLVRTTSAIREWTTL